MHTDDDSDINMVKNVMKNMCYLSSKIHSKRKNQKEKEKMKVSLIFLNKIISKCELENLSTCFYAIKSFGLGDYLSIIRRIKELEKIKKNCL